ncbi:MAG: universal stress protein [Solirubrobacteraceae bacterium]
MFKRVVVGCDGTEGARDAVVLGAAIASATGAGISLVGVHSTSLFPIPEASDLQTLRHHAEAILRKERELYAPGALVHTVADFSVPRALRHYAQHWNADLVVLGSEPSATVGHVLIGRRGRQLLYDAPFALAIAQRGLHTRDFALGRIGVGFDGESEAQAALAMAVELGRAAHAEISVLSVVEDHVPHLTSGWLADRHGYDRERDHEDLRQTALAKAQGVAKSLGAQPRVDAVIGDPGLELRTLSENVDLIVVGSRRWGPFARLVAGGVGETLVTDASCSVLIVPRPHEHDHQPGRVHAQ